jgi:group I intron endonuclease
MSIAVYQIKNIITGTVYYGSSIRAEKRMQWHLKMLDNNCHSLQYMQTDYNRYGKAAFTSELLQVFDSIESRDALYDVEQSYISTGTNMYNIADAKFGNIITRHPNRELMLAKRSATIRALNILHPERLKLHGQKVAGCKNGRYIDGRSMVIKFCPYCNRQISPGATKCTSCAAKLRVGDKNGFYGKHHSDATKQKLSDAHKGRKPKNSIPVIINDIEYASMTEASRQLHIHVTTILHRIKSPNKKFVQYTYKNIK